jgi:hypothetical protein
MTKSPKELTSDELYDEICKWSGFEEFGRASCKNDSKCVEEQLTNEQYLNRLDRRRFEIAQRF